MKSLRKLFLGSILCLALVIGTAAPMRNVEAEDKGYVTKQYSAETDIVKENGVPVYTDEDGTVDDNYLFAGWYSNADCTISLKAFAADCYAKFVDREVLTVALQTTSGTNNESEDTAVRFLTSVDSTNYKKVGFTVDIKKDGASVFNGNAKDVPTMTVFETLKEYTTDGETPKVPSDDFAKASKYFAGYELTEIKNFGVEYADANQFAWTFVITPYWTTYDDVTVNGLTKTFEINDFFYEAEIDKLNNEKHVWYPTLEGALDAAQTNNAASSVTILDDVEINGTLAITQTLTLQSREGKDITITRGAEAEDDYTYNMLQNKTESSDDVVSIQAGIDAYGNGSLTFDSFSRMVEETDDEENTEEIQERLACNVIRNDDDDVRDKVKNTSIGKLIIGEQVCIQRHEAYASSTGVSSAIYNSGELILSCDMWDNNTSYSNSPITNDNYAVLTINGGTYSWNVGSSDKGGVLHNSDNATATINGGTFKSNHAGYGGLAYCGDGSKLTIEDGVFDKNYSTHKYGAGVIRNYGATLIINGGSFTRNYTEQTNGGVLVNCNSDYNKGSATINGGTFDSNYGGTGMVNNEKDGAVFTIKGGTFTNNYSSANNRAGIAYNNAATMNIQGGTFDSNYGGRGGVVYNGSGGTLNITGGEFTNNYAYNHGGGVVENNGSSLIIAGTANSPVKMTGNYWTGTHVDNARGGGAILHSNGAKKLEISGCIIEGNNGVGKEGATAVADINVANSSTACSSVTFKDNTFTGILQINKGNYNSSTKSIVLPSTEFARETGYTWGTAYRIDWSTPALTAVDLSTLSE